MVGWNLSPKRKRGRSLRLACASGSLPERDDLMCGIAGMIDLVGRRLPPAGVLEKMAQRLSHRGPDEDGFLVRPGLGLASRRLSIVGLADGRQPIANEDQSIQVVFNGELYDYAENRAALIQRGHRLITHTDTELL